MFTENDDLLNTQEAAAILHMAAATLSQWRFHKRYPLNYVKVGRKVFYHRSALYDFIKSRTVEMSGPTPRRKR